MKLHVKDARNLFIQEWSRLAVNWGVSRSHGQVHAFLLLAQEPVTYEELKAGLRKSQGTANNIIRELMDWGIVRRVAVLGERKEYFVAEKDMWKVAQLIAKARKRRELDPLIEAMSTFSRLEGPKAEVEQMTRLVDGIKSVSAVADTALTLMDRTGVVPFLKMLS
jgi:DNA-binding transcriptional regulator GbsR (MarR family)